MIDGGINYLVILGTTGESVTLTKEEKHKIIASNIGHKQENVVIRICSWNLQFFSY